MEPWDGPAASSSPMAARSAPRSTATDCARRYIVTDDDRVIMARKPACCRYRKRRSSEVAAAARRMLLIDLEKGGSSPTKSQVEIATKHPTRPEARQHAAHPRDLKPVERALRKDQPADRQQAFGYTQEDKAADVADGDHRPGSRGIDGHDTPISAMSDKSAALHLFQAELRPGHQPADRPDPRGAGDEPGVLHRARPNIFDLVGTRAASGSKCASRS